MKFHEIISQQPLHYTPLNRVNLSFVVVVLCSPSSPTSLAHGLWKLTEFCLPIVGILIELYNTCVLLYIYRHIALIINLSLTCSDNFCVKLVLTDKRTAHKSCNACAQILRSIIPVCICCLCVYWANNECWGCERKFTSAHIRICL